MTLRPWFLIVVVALAGCAPRPTWRNPNLPPSQEHADEADCRHSAEQDIGPTNYSDPGSEKFDTPMQMVDRNDIRTEYADLIAQCMERKGYRSQN